jgi:hypothetical protein
LGIREEIVHLFVPFARAAFPQLRGRHERVPHHGAARRTR